MKPLHLVLAALVVLPAVGAGFAAGPAGPATADAPATRATDTTTVGSVAGDPADAAAESGVGDPADVTTTVAQADRPPASPRIVNVLGVGPAAANRSGFAAAYVDLGPALDSESIATSNRLETIHAVERVESAESDAERTARLRAEIRTIEERIDALDRTQRRVLAEYVEERRTARGLLVALAELDREARALDERRRRLWAVANRTGAAVPDERFAALGPELDAYHGPVRERAADAITGEGASGRFYVAATPGSVVLATLTGDAYLRETYRGDLRRIDDGRVEGSAAADAVAGAYPEVWEAREGTATEEGRVARVRVDYPGGRLEALVGSGNGRVFADEHRRSLDAVGTAATAVNTRDGLRMTANRSYAGGAMQLELRDTDGNRVNASVTIGPAGGQSVTVGRTGEDGELWVLTPGERFTVVAIRDQSVVFLTMSPLETPEPGTDGSGGG